MLHRFYYLIHICVWMYVSSLNGLSWTEIMFVVFYTMFRFQDWSSEVNSPGIIHVTQSGRIKTSLKSVSNKFQRGFESSSERIKGFARKPFKSFSKSSVLTRCFSSRNKILDPQGPFLQKWNKIFVLSCLIAVSIDPLFFYIPVIDDDKKCLSRDKKMETTATVLRSFSDIFYIIHIIFQFRTGFIAPSSRVFGRGVLVQDAWAIAKRYMASYFLVDILAVLPLPQVRKTLLSLIYLAIALKSNINIITCWQIHHVF